MHRRTSSGTVELTNMVRIDAGGARVPLTIGRRRTAAGTWEDILPTTAPLQVSGPSSITGFAAGPGASGPVTSAPLTITITGGSGSATVSWARVSGSIGIYANAPSSTTTTFTHDDVADGAPVTAVWRATVVDGLESVTHNVTVQLTYEQF